MDWNELRNEYFRECTVKDTSDEITKIKINITPHDLFEWFKKKLNSDDVISLIDKKIKDEEKLNESFDTDDWWWHTKTGEPFSNKITRLLLGLKEKIK